LAACDPTGQYGLQRELGLIKQAAQGGISTSRANGNDTVWSAWTDFCLSINQDPWLQHINDPML